MNATDTVTAALAQAEQPIRAEVFGIERLEQHAESLAAAQRTTEKPSRGRLLLPRVRENGRVLVAAYRNIVEAVQDKREIAPAEEWLLDNFFVVDEQLREIRDHLPGSYYRLLPKIAEGHLEKYPRVYGLAWAYVAHTDSRFELETLQRFVRAYQRVQPLSIGEIWAVAIHLRVALVENLRRLAQQIIGARHARAAADELADRLLGLSGRPAEDMDDVLGRLGDAPVVGAFAVELVQRLRDQDASVMPALVWLNERLSAQGTTVHDVVGGEHHAQGAANVTVRNIVTSMRWMSSVDWLEFFEGVSLVDEVLQATPGFTAMDFATRNEYRTQIELLSRGSRRSEIEVAQEAVPAFRRPSRGFRAFPSAPKRTRGTTSLATAGGYSSDSCGFVCRCDSASAAPLVRSPPPGTWPGSLHSPRSCLPSPWSSCGARGQAHGALSCWESSRWCLPRMSRCRSSIVWCRCSFRPSGSPSSSSPGGCLRSCEPSS